MVVIHSQASKAMAAQVAIANLISLWFCKDGCDDVVWQPYMLTKAKSSNKMLHELAREIPDLRKDAGRN